MFPNPTTLTPWFSDMDTHGAATAQTKGDHLMAQLSQHEFHREDEGFHSSWLAAYRQHLRSLRCLHCSAPMKIGAAELVQRTKKMLKHDSGFRPHTHGSEYLRLTDYRLFPPVHPLLEMQGMVLCWRRYVPPQRLGASPDECGFSHDECGLGEGFEIYLVLRSRAFVPHLLSPLRPRFPPAAGPVDGHDEAKTQVGARVNHCSV